MASLPSRKLRREFGYLLNTVGDYLSKNDCLKIAQAEEVPKHMIDPDSDELQVTLLHALHARRLFSPLNPDGLIEILKRVNKYDAIEEVNQYKSEERYKTEFTEREQRQQFEMKKKVPLPEKVEDIEKLLAIAQAKTSKQLAALETWESYVEKYKNRETSFVEMDEAHKKFLGRIKRTARMLTNTHSASSISSNESDSHPAIDSQSKTPLAPVQETDQQLSPKTQKKPIPLPRTRCCQSLSSPRQPRQRSKVPPTTAQLETESPIPQPRSKHSPPTTPTLQPITPAPQPTTPTLQTTTPTQQPTTPTLQTESTTMNTRNSTDKLDSENDFTGGTEDSGMGTGESDRLTWIKYSGNRY